MLLKCWRVYQRHLLRQSTGQAAAQVRLWTVRTEYNSPALRSSALLSISGEPTVVASEFRNDVPNLPLDLCSRPSQVLANRHAATKSAAPARQRLAHSQHRPSAHPLHLCSQQQAQQQQQLEAAKTVPTLSAGQGTAALAAAAAAAAALPGARCSTAAAATRVQGCRCKVQQRLCPQGRPAAPPSVTAAAAGAGRR